MRRQIPPSRGFALIIVLWAGVLLSIVAASFALEMRAESRRAGTLLARAKAEAIADAGIRRGIVALLANPSEPRRESGGSLYELPFAGGSAMSAASSKTRRKYCESGGLP